MPVERVPVSRVARVVDALIWLAGFLVVPVSLSALLAWWLPDPWALPVAVGVFLVLLVCGLCSAV